MSLALLLSSIKSNEPTSGTVGWMDKYGEKLSFYRGVWLKEDINTMLQISCE